MRIARYITTGGQTGLGRLVAERQAEPLVGELFGELAFAPGRVEVQRFLPPVQPPNIFAIGRNYQEHVQETGAQLPERPLIFVKATTALIGDGDPIRLPEAAPNEVDFEAELAIVIGRTARRVPVDRAREYVLGYTCANDVSARDCQRNDKQWARAKGFDTFCPLGPWLVTPDELSPQDRPLRSRLNGVVMQNANTSAMIFGCDQLISYLSHQFTLLPGTVILTGTPEGVGFARRPPVFLKPGDRVEVEIEGLGVLTNPVLREAD